MKIAAVPFHIWKSLVEKGGAKISDLPKTWDAFMDFFKPVQKGLRKPGMRNVYALGYQLTANGVDPINTFNAWMIAYGGQDLVTPDGKLHTDDPQVKAACVQAIKSLTTAVQGRLCAAELRQLERRRRQQRVPFEADGDGFRRHDLDRGRAVHDKEQYDDILTHGLPLSNDGKELPSQVALFGPVIPKGAKNVAVAKEFAKYMIQPKVLNQYLKAGLGRWALPIPEIVKSDPFWLKEDPHRTAYVDAVGDRARRSRSTRRTTRRSRRSAPSTSS